MPNRVGLRGPDAHRLWRREMECAGRNLNLPRGRHPNFRVADKPPGMTVFDPWARGYQFEESALQRSRAASISLTVDWYCSLPTLPKLCRNSSIERFSGNWTSKGKKSFLEKPLRRRACIAPAAMSERVAARANHTPARSAAKSPKENPLPRVSVSNCSFIRPPASLTMGCSRTESAALTA